MTKNIFRKYLINLGFTDVELSSFLCENIFNYAPDSTIPSLKYIHTKDIGDIFNYHLQLWNRNHDNVFVAIGENKTYIIDCKKKPQVGIIQSIKTFDYGVNSADFKDVDIDVISKSYIDSSYFFHFIQQKQRKKQEVDKHLLLNLIALRNDLLENGNEQVIHLIILRCLFVKYLEDRGIFTPNYLSEILASKSVDLLIAAFGEVCKINGDVFGGNTLTKDDIKENYLDKLHLFFTSDYQSRQKTLFPYQFDNIPIQLISHVYEAFLNDNTKKGKGVYYTPSFVVNFMLSQSLKQKAEENPYLTIFDPAVGSAAFLVESFKIIRDAQAQKAGKSRLSYDEKKLILQKQLWGVDVDSDALQIAAFSLYLVLLEDESSEFIRDKIENSHPILPSLIGNTLKHANTIIDFVFKDEKFDFIVSNPPWGSVPNDVKEEYIAEREAINNKSGAYPEYNEVADYERSQAFLRRIERWQKPDTTIVMIVKNSIFLNDKAVEFRKEFISKNKLETFYELSDYNKILFKKRTFTSAMVNIEIGASEPCAIVIFKPKTEDSDYKIHYIAPKLTKLGEHFEIIQYTSNESYLVDKSEFIENDLLWKVLANGNIEDLNLIQKIKEKKDLNITIESGRGFEPKKGGELSGQPIWKDWLDIDCFHKYKIDNLKKFNWNQNFRNKRDFIYETDSIAIARRPLKRDSIRLKATIASKGIVYKDNIVFAKIRKVGQYVEDYNKYNLLFNSSLIGFYLNHVSGQWGKGDEKWAALRTKDIEELPICNVSKIEEFNLSDITNDNLLFDQHKIDENIYNLYELTDYEKEIINEFYQVNVDRANDKLKYVQPRDMQTYFEAFKESFELILSGNHTLNASYSISSNIGAIIKISIVEKAYGKKLEQDNTLEVLQFVKNKQLSETDKLLKEEKIKLYESTHFYIIKSNQFKDWTKRQAFKDAKEEIDLLLSNLPNTNER